MFIAYASAPGRTASDRGERSGPYAAALAAELGKAGLDHLNMFQNVKEAVLATTGGAQQPWESNGLGRRIYLTGQPKPVPQASQELAALKEQLTRFEAELKRQQESGAGTAKEMTALKEALAKSQAELKRREEQQKQQVAIAEPPKPAPTVPTPAAQPTGPM